MNLLSTIIDNNYDAIFNALANGQQVPAVNLSKLQHVIYTNVDAMEEETTATERGLIKSTMNAVIAPYLGFNTQDPSNFYFDGDEYVIDGRLFMPAGFSIGDQYAFGCYFSAKTNEWYPNGLTWVIQLTVTDATNGILTAQVFSVAIGGARTAISELFRVFATPGVNFGEFYLPLQIRRYLNSIYFWVADGMTSTPVKIDGQNPPFIYVVRSLINASNEKILPYISHDQDNNISAVNRGRFSQLKTSIVKYFPETIQPSYLSLADGHYSVNKLDFVTVSNNYPLYHQYNIDLTAKNTNGVNILPNSVRISNVETVDGYVHVYLGANHYIIKPQSELSLQLSGENSLLVKGEDNCTVTLYDSGSLNLYGR